MECESVVCPSLVEKKALQRQSIRGTLSGPKRGEEGESFSGKRHLSNSVISSLFGFDWYSKQKIQRGDPRFEVVGHSGPLGIPKSRPPSPPPLNHLIVRGALGQKSVRRQRSVLREVTGCSIGCVPLSLSLCCPPAPSQVFPNLYWPQAPHFRAPSPVFSMNPKQVRKANAQNTSTKPGPVVITGSFFPFPKRNIYR